MKVRACVRACDRCVQSGLALLTDCRGMAGVMCIDDVVSTSFDAAGVCRLSVAQFISRRPRSPVLPLSVPLPSLSSRPCIVTLAARSPRLTLIPGLLRPSRGFRSSRSIPRFLLSLSLARSLAGAFCHLVGAADTPVAVSAHARHARI